MRGSYFFNEVGNCIVRVEKDVLSLRFTVVCYPHYQETVNSER